MDEDRDFRRSKRITWVDGAQLGNNGVYSLLFTVVKAKRGSGYPKESR